MDTHLSRRHPGRRGPRTPTWTPAGTVPARSVTTLRLQHAHMTQKYMRSAAGGRAWRVAVAAGCTTLARDEGNTELAPSTSQHHFGTNQQRHCRLPVPAQHFQYRLDVCKGEFRCRRAREVSTDARRGLGKSCRAYRWSVLRPSSKPRVPAITKLATSVADRTARSN